MTIHEAPVPMSTSDRAFCMVVWDWGSLGIDVEVWDRVLPVASQQLRGALGLTGKDGQLWPPEEVYGNGLNNSRVALEYHNCTVYRWWTFSQLSNENKAAATCQKASIWIKSSWLCGRRRGWDVSRQQHRNVCYLGWNRSPAQVECMRQALGPGALGRPRGIGWRGRWEGGSGWGTHVNPWLFHFNVWQKSTTIKKKKFLAQP